MKAAMTAAVSGMMDASARIAGAADRTARRTGEALNAAFSAQAREAAASDGSSRTNGAAKGLPSGLNAGAVPLSQSSYIPSMAEDAVTMQVAAASYKANAKVLGVTGELQKALLDSLARTRD